MTVLDKIAALFAAARPEDLDGLTPVERERFGQLCRHWADRAERPPAPKSGVLAELRGLRREG
jgi:hypothetical protein